MLKRQKISFLLSHNHRWRAPTGGSKNVSIDGSVYVSAQGETQSKKP
jgi:hypothetical protein